MNPALASRLGRILAAAMPAVVAALLSNGCSNYSKPTVAAAPLSPAEREFEIVWRASLDTLGDYDFAIDRQDRWSTGVPARREGLIATEPMTGQYAGECWRKDAATGRDLCESTIQTIYRQAFVSIHPIEGQEDRFTADVKVWTYRSNRPQPQVTSTSEALNMFRLPGSDQERKQLLEYAPGETPEGLAPLGRDEGLERKLANDIAEAAIKGRMRG